MGSDRGDRRRGRLTVAAAALFATAASAVAQVPSHGDLVIIESNAPAHAVGTVLPFSAFVLVGEGQWLTLITSTGETTRLFGPWRGPMDEYWSDLERHEQRRRERNRERNRIQPIGGVTDGEELLLPPDGAQEAEATPDGVPADAPADGG